MLRGGVTNVSLASTVDKDGNELGESRMRVSAPSPGTTSAAPPSVTNVNLVVRMVGDDDGESACLSLLRDVKSKTSASRMREREESERRCPATADDSVSLCDASSLASRPRVPVMAAAKHEPSVRNRNAPYLTDFPERVRYGWFRSNDLDTILACDPLPNVNIYLYGSANCRIVGKTGSYEWNFTIFTTGK